ncbi:hypothetical protein CHUAL_000807 [Chamberlinius hualienensis]
MTGDIRRPWEAENMSSAVHALTFSLKMWRIKPIDGILRLVYFDLDGAALRRGKGMGGDHGDVIVYTLTLPPRVSAAAIMV